MQEVLQAKEELCASMSAQAEQAKADLHDINEHLTNQVRTSAAKAASLQATVQELEAKLAAEDQAHQVGGHVLCSSLNCPTEGLRARHCTDSTVQIVPSSSHSSHSAHLSCLFTKYLCKCQCAARRMPQARLA